MADIMLTSLSALLASQRSLATTGHNIANVNTPGYSRQRVDLVTRPPSGLGNLAIGNGVYMAGVSRSYDSFQAAELRLDRITGQNHGWVMLETTVESGGARAVAAL